jgi:hypothetical protein
MYEVNQPQLDDQGEIAFPHHEEFAAVREKNFTILPSAGPVL